MFGFKVVRRSKLDEIAELMHAFQIGYEDDLPGSEEVNCLYKELHHLAWQVYWLAGYHPGFEVNDPR